MTIRIQRFPAARALFLALAIVTVHSEAGQATAIPFTEALQFTYNPGATGVNYSNPCCDYNNTVNSSPPTAATSTTSQSGAWGSVYGYASADLASGQLRTQGTVVNTDGTAAPTMQTNAIFGDSFTASTASGTPFNWTANSRAAFNINLDGMLSGSDSLQNLGAGAFVVLSILRPGTLDPTQPLINGPTAETYFYWNIGNPNQQIYYTDQQGNSQLLTATADFNTLPASLTASFNPDGNFDWVLLLGSSGQLGNAGTSYDIDLSHTLTLGYSGPDGSVTTSASALFTNFDATLPPAVSVPEPSTILLLGAGLAGTLVRRRRA